MKMANLVACVFVLIHDPVSVKYVCTQGSKEVLVAPKNDVSSPGYIYIRECGPNGCRIRRVVK